ncbi:MAG: hypothetical protein JEZ03_01650 [Bacteroidales bacterium]|nr:hypothetical protein [Bacteroidales bacterium]
MSKVMVHSTLESGYDYHIKNRYGKQFHFRISSFDVPTGLLSEAYEVVQEEEREPNVYTVLGSYDEDVQDQESRLKAKIKNGINQIHIVNNDGRFSLGERNKLAGRIEYNELLMDTRFERVMIVDGKRITIEDFAGMLESFEGFCFKFEIIDPVDMDFD